MTTLASALGAYFGWPNGQVWPNLVASVAWALPGFVVSHVLLRRQHAKKTDQQTAELKEHITSTLKGRDQ